MRITTKRQMQAMLKAEALGPTVKHLEGMEEVPYCTSLVGMRYLERGGPCIPSCEPATLIQTVPELLNLWWDLTKMYFYEAPPNNQTFNAELSCINGLPYIHYSVLNMAMRPALAQGGRHADGLIVWSILKQYLWPESFEMLRELYDAWCEDHVIEFSAFDSRPARGGNMVIWEIRAY